MGLRRRHPDLVDQVQPGLDDPVSYTARRMDMGLVTDLNSAEAPVESVSSLDGWRFESGGIRKDFGAATVGSAAATRVLAMVEHRYTAAGSTLRRVLRITRTAGGLLSVEFWDSGGSSWVQSPLPSALQPIENVYLSVVSAQNVVAIADGKRIYMWQEEPVLTHHIEDFAANEFISSGNTSDATISPAGAVLGVYLVNFSIRWKPARGATARITLAARINTVAVERTVIEKTFVDEVGEFSEDHVFTVVHPATANNDLLDLNIESSSLPAQNRREGPFVDVGVLPPPGFLGVIPQFQILIEDAIFIPFPEVIPVPAPLPTTTYTIRFEVNVQAASSITVRFYIPLFGLPEDATYPLTLIDFLSDEVYTTSGFKEKQITVVTFGPRFGFGFEIVAETGSGGSIINLDESDVRWTETPAFLLHPWNSAFDPKGGVEYDVDSGTKLRTIEELAIDAPLARYVFEFGDRLVALHDTGDMQSFACSADGDFRKWQGIDTEQIFLPSSAPDRDPIDELQAVAYVGNAVGALFRSQSIMRMIETGNVDLPVAVVKWLDHLGTRSPFSVRQVHQGVMFLGHDLNVYFLNESTLEVVSPLIHTELLRTIPDGSVHLVDSTYDTRFGVYFLGIPSFTFPEEIAEIWMFEHKLWLLDKVPRWRRRVQRVERMTAVSGLVT